MGDIPEVVMQAIKSDARRYADSKRAEVTELDKESLARAACYGDGTCCCTSAYECEVWDTEYIDHVKLILQDIERQGFQITKRGDDG